MDKDSAEQINKSFMLDLTANLLKEGQNLLVSPFSLVLALSMALAGSAGQSRLEMLNVLFGIKAETIEKEKDEETFFKTLLTSFTNELRKFLLENESVLSNANMLYCDNGFIVKKEYFDLLSKQFETNAKQLNFSEEVESLGIINGDVKKATKGLIPELLERIPPGVVLILLNAIHFKGMWKFPFPKESVRDGTFTKSDGQTKTVKMMSVEKRFPFYYCETLNAKVVQLPYSSGSVSMIIILPDQESIMELTRKFNSNHLDEILERIHAGGQVQLTMPKFKIESTHSLIPPLQSLGLQTIFDNRANFSGISDTSIFVSDVIQKAVIEVNEEGTEAAAATAIMMMRCLPPEPESFIADHPFMFLMVSNDNRHILFSGIVEDPSY